MPLQKPQYGVGGWGPVVDAIIDWYNANENGFVVDRDRVNHTGFQAISTVSGLQAALDAKAALASPTFTGTVTASRFVPVVQTLPFAASITPNAANGNVFRIVATGDLTLSDPSNGSDGQEVLVEVKASGADRVLSFASGGLSSVVIPSGVWWSGVYRRHATDAEWYLDDNTVALTSASILDFTEAVQDAVAAMIVAGTNVTSTYNDATGTLTLSSTGGGSTDPEVVRDTIGAALVGGTNVTVTVNDASDSITIATSATVNSTDAQLRDRSTHTGTQSADTLTDGTTNKAYTAAEKTKLSGVAAGATANSADATLLARANHTGSQPSSTISDFTEAVQDVVGALLAAGTNVTLNYDDAANTLSIAATGSGGLDAEAVRDAIGIALVGSGLISVVVNDAADTITITTTATQNSTDAVLLARANHTGTQSADTVTDGTTNKAYTATEKTKLSGIAVGATVNSTDATLLNRANHTGSQAISTVTSLQSSLDAKAPLASPTFTGTVTLPRTVSTPVSVTYAATTTIDASLGTRFKITATGALTLNPPSNPVDGQQITVSVLASGASRTLTLSASILLTTGLTSPITIASGKKQILALLYDGDLAAWILIGSTQQS